MDHLINEWDRTLTSITENWKMNKRWEKIEL
jgi:hypothetical protein